MSQFTPGESRPPQGEFQSTQDELSSAKQRLMEAVDPPKPQGAGGSDMAGQGIKLVQQHPYLFAGAAIVAGLVVARVPGARYALKAGLVWGAKVAVTRYLRQYVGK